MVAGQFGRQALQTPSQGAFQGGRNSIPVGFLFQDSRKNLPSSVAVEQPLARHHFIENEANKTQKGRSYPALFCFADRRACRMRAYFGNSPASRIRCLSKRICP
jgi:hypothetical protein